MNKFYSKKTFLSLLLVALFWSTFFNGCKKTDSNTGTSTSAPPDLTTKVSSSISGFITDENNAAVTNATVQFGTATLTTDKYGYFEVKNVDVIKDAATVTVTKAGYFKGIKTYIAEAGKSAFFRIKLIPKTTAGTINSGAGGTVRLTNGLSVTLPVNAVVNATSNAAYTGTINLAVYWINPASAELPSVMPGDLRGINTAGNMQLLTTYGMAAVELTGSGGELLQMATGKTATLSFPIPTALSSSAPASIPLWYFDEAKGLWQQEGSATKSGNNYIGEVSHFSFWNCDVPQDLVQFNCTIADTNGQPISQVFVKISRVNDPSSAGYGYTDSSGYVAGPVPKNSQLLLEVFSSTYCSTPLYSQTFTTANTSISLGTIKISSTILKATVTGTATTCANLPIPTGFIIVKAGFECFRYPILNGAFNFNIVLCSSPSNISIVAEDVLNLQQSNVAAYSLKVGNNTIGNIQACGVSPQEHLTYTINGTPYSFFKLPDSIRTYITGVPNRYFVECISSSINSYNNMELFFEGGNMSVGSQQALVAFRGLQISANQVINTPIWVKITEYGSIGQFVAGNFAGVITETTPGNPSFNVTCNFRIKRIF